MTSFLLKIIALLSMLSDHCTDVFEWGVVGNYIGRLAFPLYAFMIVDSFRHLSGGAKGGKASDRMKRFMLSLGIMAIVSEPAFDYAFYGKLLYPSLQNQLLQFVSYGLVLLLAARVKKRWQTVLLWLVTIVVNQVLFLGYGAAGILLMLLMNRYLERFEEKGTGWRLSYCAAIMLLFVFLGTTTSVLWNMQIRGVQAVVPTLGNTIVQFLKAYGPAFFAAPFMALYNGEYGNIPKWFRAVYRYFYPAHLWVLAAVRVFFLR